jgi:hypothetical protein
MDGDGMVEIGGAAWWVQGKEMTGVDDGIARLWKRRRARDGNMH